MTIATDVLLLDDDQDILDAIGEIITFLSKRTVLKASSVAGLKTLGERALHAGLAILDINLGMDAPSGLDGLHWLRQSGFTGRAVFLTAHARGLPSVEAAHGEKDVAVLSKPMSVDALRALLGEAP